MESTLIPCFCTSRNISRASKCHELCFQMLMLSNTFSEHPMESNFMYMSIIVFPTCTIMAMTSEMFACLLLSWRITLFRISRSFSKPSRPNDIVLKYFKWSTSHSVLSSIRSIYLLNRWCNSTTGKHLSWQQGGNKVPMVQEQSAIQLSYISQEEHNYHYHAITHFHKPYLDQLALQRLLSSGMILH